MSSASIQTILGFICNGVSNVDGYKRNAIRQSELSVTNLVLFEHQLADIGDPCVINYGSD